jgi:hypothetical protein
VYVWTEDPPAPRVAPVTARASADAPATAVIADDDGEDDGDAGAVAATPALPVALVASPAAPANAGPSPPAPPPPPVPDRIVKLRLHAESFVNGVKTDAPFVRRHGADVWNVQYRMEVRLCV